MNCRTNSVGKTGGPKLVYYLDTGLNEGRAVTPDLPRLARRVSLVEKEVFGGEEESASFAALRGRFGHCARHSNAGLFYQRCLVGDLAPNE